MDSNRLLKQRIRRLKQLPTLPSLLRELFEVLQDEQSNFADIARIIKHDQTITERILRVANSPYFGHSGYVSTIEQAIMFLGYDLVKGICLGASVFKLLDGGKKRTLSNLWRHSFEVGIIAANIADQKSSSDPSVCFVAGLLHDIGRVVLLTLDMKKYLKIISSDDLVTEEMDNFGLDHSLAGAEFLRNANLPEEIIAATLFHHRPEEAESFPDLVGITAVAELLSRRFFPKDEDDGICSEQAEGALSRLGLDDQDLIILGEVVSRQAGDLASAMSMN
jgi:putative nucleotidyltransferase with HDIG domain